MPMRRRSGGTCRSALDTTSSPIRMRPASGLSKPAIWRSSVVLPQPDAPRIATNSPSSTSSDTSSSAVNAPNDLVDAVDRQSRHGSTPGGSLCATSSVDSISATLTTTVSDAERRGVGRVAALLEREQHRRRASRRPTTRAAPRRVSSLNAVRKISSAPAAAAGASSGKHDRAQPPKQPRAGDLRRFLERAVELVVAADDRPQAEHEEAREIAEQHDPDGVVERDAEHRERLQEQQDRRDREHDARAARMAARSRG